MAAFKASFELVGSIMEVRSLELHGECLDEQVYITTLQLISRMYTSAMRVRLNPLRLVGRKIAIWT